MKTSDGTGVAVMLPMTATSTIYPKSILCCKETRFSFISYVKYKNPLPYYYIIKILIIQCAYNTLDIVYPCAV